jgi:acyl-CoA thioester hydrolase
VEFSDTDAAGIVHFSSFMLWMESVEHELLRAAGVAVFDQRPDGSVESWPRVSVSCDYQSAIRFGDVIDIEAGVLKVGRTSVTYQFRFALDGKPVATGRVVAVRCRLGEAGRPQAVLVPEEIVDRLSGYGFPEDRAADATT